MMILHVILDFGNKKILMGQLNKYKCKNCDFEIVAAPEGVSVLMDGAYAHFLCPTCKNRLLIWIFKAIPINLNALSAAIKISTNGRQKTFAPNVGVNWKILACIAWKIEAPNY